MSKTFRIHYHLGPQDKMSLEIRPHEGCVGAPIQMHDEGDEHSVTIDNTAQFEYRYVLSLADGPIAERHWRPSPAAEADLTTLDEWRSPESGLDALAAPAFADALFGNFPDAPQLPNLNAGTLTIVLREPRVPMGLEIRVVSKQFIAWETSHALKMTRCQGYNWVLDLPHNAILKEFEFKFCLWDTAEDKFLRYEDGFNRSVTLPAGETRLVNLNGLHSEAPFRVAGVAVPIFSLRTKQSRGCGEFLDLKPLADWCQKAKLRVIQLLPINDTTAQWQWRDSYPYNAISIMALHPNYVNVQDVYQYYGARLSSLEKETGMFLNDINYSDYNRTRDWKNGNLRALFMTNFERVVGDERLQEYRRRNADWLDDYAAFCALRDKHRTPDFREWGNDCRHSRELVEALFQTDNELYKEVMYRVFLQFHLERQLRDAINYVHSKGIAIKGDLPIGINPKSADAWTSPELFDFGLQAGAPPDFFSHDGQNWGFPIYRWDVMARDGYAWWSRRIERMQAFFDVFRIDHILGFFRLWSIPFPFQSGLMGLFSPALPLSDDELHRRGFNYDIAQFARPNVTEPFLRAQLGEHAQAALQLFDRQNDGSLTIKPEYFSPIALEPWIAANVQQTSRERIRQGLANILHEVLFVSVKHGEWHPRILLEETDRFKRLSEWDRGIVSAIANDFFYHRNDTFWRHNAEEHLGAVLSKCRMLVCGEDLGMIPASVPVVMRNMQILSLEMQRMPKANWERFGNPATYPYLSVCATSSHDISGIRGWWEEEKDNAQWFYNNVLHHEGHAPGYASGKTVQEIVCQHLDAPSMLCVNPIQDYAGMVDNMPHLLPFEERINVPSNPQQQWRYRVPFNVDDLTTIHTALQEKLADIIDKSKRS